MRYLTTGLVLVIAVLGGFYGGWKYSQSKITAAPAAAVTGAAAGTGAGQGGAGTGASGGSFRGGGTAGQVVSYSGNVLTLKDVQGNTVKVTLPDGTLILRTSAGSVTDLVPGVTVTINGQRAADGSVTAVSVTVVPSGLRPGPGASPGG